MLPSCEKLVKALPVALQRRLPKKVIVIRVTEQESKVLNHKYRRKRKAANILSFRYGPEYGELIICPEVIRRDAKKSGRPYRLEVKLMIAHGLLHLAGLHHEKSAKNRKKFEELESKLLAKMYS